MDQTVSESLSSRHSTADLDAVVAALDLPPSHTTAIPSHHPHGDAARSERRSSQTIQADLRHQEAKSRCRRYYQWLVRQCEPWLGSRVLDAGAGIGNLSTHLLDRERLVLVDRGFECVTRLQSRFGGRPNVRVVQADLADPAVETLWTGERFDTVVCAHVLEQVRDDEDVLEGLHDSLVAGGHCVVVAAAGRRLYNGLDLALGRYRRYSPAELRGKMERAGFEVIATCEFGRLAALGWSLKGRLLKHRRVGRFAAACFDRVWPVARLLDACVPFPGLALLMVGRRYIVK